MVGLKHLLVLLTKVKINIFWNQSLKYEFYKLESKKHMGQECHGLRKKGRVFKIFSDRVSVFRFRITHDIPDTGL